MALAPPKPKTGAHRRLKPLRPACTKEGGVSAAIQTGGCGFCRGFGRTATSRNVKCTPSWFTRSSVQACRMIDRLVEEPTGFRLVDGVAAELVRLVTATDAEVDTAAAHDVEERELLGDADRVVKGEDDDPGAEPHPLGQRHEGGQHERGGDAVAVLREVMLRGPDRIEAVVLRGAQDLHLLRHHLCLGLANGVLEKMQHAEFERHRAILLGGRCPASHVVAG
jgi:hypothetical protein